MGARWAVEGGGGMTNRESDDRDAAARLAEYIAGPLVHCIWCGGAVDPYYAAGPTGNSEPAFVRLASGPWSWERPGTFNCYDCGFRQPSPPKSSDGRVEDCRHFVPSLAECCPLCGTPTRKSLEREATRRQYKEKLEAAFRMTLRTSIGADRHRLARSLFVASLFLEYGGSLDDVFAAFLHDAFQVLEDHIEAEMVATEIQELFGERVARIVVESQEVPADLAQSWRWNKRMFLRRLPALSPSARLISLARAVHDAQQLLAALRRDAPAALRAQGCRGSDLAWFYTSLGQLLREGDGEPIRVELDHVSAEVERLVASRPGRGHGSDR